MGKLGERAGEMPSEVAGGKGASGFDEVGCKLDIAGGVVGVKWEREAEKQAAQAESW